MTFKKGDIAARVTERLTHYGFGSGKPPSRSTEVQIVKVASAKRDGKVRTYITHPGGAPLPNDSGRIPQQWLSISGPQQVDAEMLFDAATGPADLSFDGVEAAKAAILAASLGGDTPCPRKDDGGPAFPSPDHFRCDFGSSCDLWIGLNARHVVIAIRDGGQTASVGIVPGTMRRLGTRLVALANEYDAAARTKGDGDAPA